MPCVDCVSHYPITLARSLSSGVSLSIRSFALLSGFADSSIVIALLILGLPVALVVAWAFDVGPDGIERSQQSRRPVGRYGFGLFLLLCIALAGSVTYLRVTPPDTPATQIADTPRIAVLPIADLSPGGSQLHLSDGFHDELISQLAGLSGIAVSSRTSVLPYRAASKSLPEIAEELKVDAIVEGSIRYDDDRMRFTVQLIDARTDEHIWSNRYDAEVSTHQMFAIQEDVATQITSALKVQLTEPDRTRLARIPTDNLDAYVQYALGRYHLWRWNPGDLSRAIGFFERSLEYDPDFAEANVDLGWAYALSGTSYGKLRPDVAFPKARHYARRALELAPGQFSVRELLLDIQFWYDWRWDGLDEEFGALIADHPREASGYVSYAFYLAAAGRFDEAIEQVEFAMSRNPRSPSTMANAGWRYLYANRCEEAIDVANLILEIDDTYDEARLIIGSCQLHTGQLQEALAHFRRLNFGVLEAYTLGRMGEEEQAREIVDNYLADVESGNYFPPISIAICMTGLGDRDAAFEWLERALEARNRNLVLLNIDPIWNPIRDDARFRAIAAKVGLPADQSPDRR